MNSPPQAHAGNLDAESPSEIHQGTPIADPTASPESVDAPIPEGALTRALRDGQDQLAALLRDLNAVWHDYRSAVFRTPLVSRILGGQFSCEDYQQWMAQWIPQVREGSVWMRNAVRHLPAPFDPVRELMHEHASEEQFDFRILYDDYQKAGGTLPLDALRRNPGGEALNAYMHAVAASDSSYALLGGIFIIEGTGQRIIPSLLPRLKNQLGVGLGAYRFLQYHGENDVHHLERWLSGVEMVLNICPDAPRKILQTARHVARLYALQWESAAISPPTRPTP